ncbi:type I restriction enzyme HsdR N-terminal domain-containing protein [Salinibacter ruber]|jgi:hypothetical protein|uniref:Type I restriction enzyme R protein N-terminal domain-containing protein n=1 Tax=Salinibacter ruber TaxID=146919 RepID=A0A9X2ZSS6_9BACT|nr:type I restriction enzyme HsdR N-terminal domain-containing protein [Salinibacter ruber]MCS3656771.1 hypothetical protein [Salinibacter ruber]MCS3683540.1 hypothetical protein [Salinibacter ruber]MCS3704524.1 hypothetical protein [Salinibacter ruber]MCS3757346.1 hypothetical protein [Salinibacter ruber]MCS3951877.1 hypothetical protein [Salinibacter ruber]
MDLADRLSMLRARADGQRAALDCQKTTETALVLPFFDALGYDPFDVRAVEPEASVEGEDETVDYALKRDGRPVMLVECTAATKPLEAPGAPALLRHAEAMDVPLVLFTNGIRFQFYAVDEGEAEPPDGPALDFDLLDHSSNEVDVLRRLARPVFEADAVGAAMRAWTRSRQVRSYLTQQRDAPDAPLVQFVATQICDENVSGDELDRLRSVVQNVLDELLGATEDDNERPAPRAESPVPPGGADADTQRRTGVFEKDIVKRALNDL